MDVHTCETCSKTFKTRESLLKHVRTIHVNPVKHDCNLCGLSYSTKSNLKKHQAKSCVGAKKRDASPDQHDRNIRRRYESTCIICHRSFLGFQALRNHLSTSHNMQPIELLSQFLPPDVTQDEALMRCIRENVNLIMRPNVNRNLSTQFNFFNFGHLGMADLEIHIREITRDIINAVKINFSIGFVMQNIETGEYHFYYAEKNNYILDDMFQISTPEDVLTLLNRIRELDIIEVMCQDRPNSKFKLVHITNVLYDLHHLDYSFGNEELVLPDYITNRKCITSLVRTSDGKDISRDRLCAFRAISCHQLDDTRHVETRTKENFAKWVGKYQCTIETFNGITLKQIPLLEELFEVNICAYNLQLDNTAQVLYSSACFYAETMHVNIYDSHISYINNFATYAKKFECVECDKLFNRIDGLKKHQKTCQDTRMVYPGGHYTAKQNIYDLLEEYGISVQKNQRYYPYYSVFDFESLLHKSDSRAGNATQIIAEHVPISVALSNSINNEVICYVNESSTQLVTSMLAYCNSVQLEANRLMLYRFSSILAKLEQYVIFLVSLLRCHPVKNK